MKYNLHSAFHCVYGVSEEYVIWMFGTLPFSLSEDWTALVSRFGNTYIVSMA